MSARRVLAHLRHRMVTRRCKACDHRYRRRLPNCPVCKTTAGHDGIDRGHTWASGIGLGGPPGGSVGGMG